MGWGVSPGQRWPHSLVGYPSRRDAWDRRFSLHVLISDEGISQAFSGALNAVLGDRPEPTLL